jgi:beta-lactamase class A
MPAPSQEITALTQKLQALAKPFQSKIKPYAYFIDVDNGQYVNLAGTQTLPAASTIKVPIAIAFFEDVDAGKVMLQEQLPLTKEVIASGSGDMQYQVGKVKSYSALETVTKMIVISDNTATNMLIKRLGGQQALNQRFQSWGLSQTVINNPLPDLEGTNKTSPQDLVKALIKVHQGDSLSLKSRDRLLNILQGTKTRTLLPQGLEKDAQIAHKTGDIGTLLGDTGIIDMPNGKRYIGAVMATRPYNDPAARTLIQNISRTVYQHFKGMTPPPPPVASKPASKPTPPLAKPKASP